MILIITSYRARDAQTFRRDQLVKMIENVKLYFTKNKVDFKMVICEQNNDVKFNRGILLNIGFIESEKKFAFEKKYMHLNVDYNLDINVAFPQKIMAHQKGFLDLYRPPLPVLGAACVFDTNSYLQCNGFPNDLYGWGGDDWAIYNRIVQHKIPLQTELLNSRFIIDINQLGFKTDTSSNEHNMSLAKRNDSKTNGVSTCRYIINGYGEFHDNETIFHILCHF